MGTNEEDKLARRVQAIANEPPVTSNASVLRDYAPDRTIPQRAATLPSSPTAPIPPTIESRLNTLAADPQARYDAAKLRSIQPEAARIPSPPPEIPPGAIQTLGGDPPASYDAAKLRSMQPEMANIPKAAPNIVDPLPEPTMNAPKAPPSAPAGGAAPGAPAGPELPKVNFTDTKPVPPGSRMGGVPGDSTRWYSTGPSGNVAGPGFASQAEAISTANEAKVADEIRARATQNRAANPTVGGAGESPTVKMENLDGKGARQASGPKPAGSPPPAAAAPAAEAAAAPKPGLAGRAAAAVNSVKSAGVGGILRQLPSFAGKLALPITEGVSAYNAVTASPEEIQRYGDQYGMDTSTNGGNILARGGKFLEDTGNTLTFGAAGALGEAISEGQNNPKYADYNKMPVFGGVAATAAAAADRFKNWWNAPREPAPVVAKPDMKAQAESEIAANAAHNANVAEFQRQTADENAPDHWHSAVRHIESRGNPNAVSPKGAVGDMQTMPSTLRDPGFGVVPARDNSPAEQSRVGHDYLDALYRRYGGDTTRTLAAYNWGPGNTDKWIAAGADPSKLPPETRSYINQFAQLTANAPPAAPGTRRWDKASSPTAIAQAPGEIDPNTQPVQIIRGPGRTTYAIPGKNGEYVEVPEAAFLGGKTNEFLAAKASGEVDNANPFAAKSRNSIALEQERARTQRAAHGINGIQAAELERQLAAAGDDQKKRDEVIRTALLASKDNYLTTGGGEYLAPDGVTKLKQPVRHYSLIDGKVIGSDTPVVNADPKDVKRLRADPKNQANIIAFNEKYPGMAQYYLAGHADGGEIVSRLGGVKGYRAGGKVLPYTYDLTGMSTDSMKTRINRPLGAPEGAFAYQYGVAAMEEKEAARQAKRDEAIGNEEEVIPRATPTPISQNRSLYDSTQDNEFANGGIIGGVFKNGGCVSKKFADGGAVKSPDNVTNIASQIMGGHGQRHDGTINGDGYLGKLQTSDGKTMTELSADAPAPNGNGSMHYPLITPNQSFKDVSNVLTGGKPSPQMQDAAYEHAASRKLTGRDTFAGIGEQVGIGYKKGGLIGGCFRRGGMIRGAGDGTSDSVPAKIAETGEPIRLSDGEYELSPEAVAKIGVDNLNKLLAEHHQPAEKNVPSGSFIIPADVVKKFGKDYFDRLAAA